MKRIVAGLLVLMLALVGCTPAGSKTQDVTIRVSGLKGPTGMGMVKLMEDSEAGEAKGQYEFQVLAAPDEVPGLITTGEVDIAAVPTNMAALLYQKTEGDVRMLALNTLGVLYLLQGPGQNVESVDDLEGKTIISAGQGATPEYALQYILDAFGINATIEYKAEHAEVASLLLAGEADLALLPEPQVTSALLKDEGITIALDLTQLWPLAAEAKGDAQSEMAMGCLIVRKAFLEAHPEAVKTFLEEYAASTAYVNENHAEAGRLIEKFDIMPAAAPAQQAIERSNITCITGDAMRSDVSGFLKALFDANPASVGGAAPADDLYYLG